MPAFPIAQWLKTHVLPPSKVFSWYSGEWLPI